MHKLLYVCLDGLGDDPIPELDGRTPLEARRDPHPRRARRRGAPGSVITVGQGIAPESDIARVRDPRLRPQRGASRAAACWRRWASAWTSATATSPTASTSPPPTGRRSSIVASAGTSRPRSRRPSPTRSTRRCSLPDATFDAAGDGRASWRPGDPLDDGGPLSADVTNTDPAYRKEGHLGVALETFEPVVATGEPLDDSDAARHAAELTNAFVEGSARILDASEVNARAGEPRTAPGNLILTRDGGDHRPALQPIADRFGLRGGASSRCRSNAGIALIARDAARRRSPADASDAPAERYAAWAELAAEALGGYRRAVRPHQGAGRARARRARRGQARLIAAIDRAFFGEVLPRSTWARHGRGRHRGPRHLVRAEGAHRRPGAARWSAAGGSNRTARRRSASGLAEPARSGRCEGSRSCPGSPPAPDLRTSDTCRASASRCNPAISRPAYT